MKIRRRYAIPLGILVIVVIGSFIGLPTRSLFEQRLDLRRASAELSELESSNDALDLKLEQWLQEDAIEIQAREQFGLVYPGDESYTVPPAPLPSFNLPKGWPLELLQDPLQRAADRRRLEYQSQLDR